MRRRQVEGIDRIDAGCGEVALQALTMTSNSAHPLRRPAGVTVDAAWLDRAEAPEIDISKASEEGLVRAVRQRQAARWLEANRAALQSSNEFVERHGLPLAKHRSL